MLTKSQNPYELIKRMKSKYFFLDNNRIEIKPGSIEHAYLCVLEDDLESAKTIFASLDSPRAKWGKALCSILEGYIEEYPTYFQIRNFLEIDMDFLLKNEKLDFVEQLLGGLELLSAINYETYKFAARVMFENKFFSAALKYMEKSKMLRYNDPELHFMLAKYYLEVHDDKKAYDSICECLTILPDYYPARIIKAKIEERIY